MAAFSQPVHTDVNGVKVVSRYDSTLAAWVTDNKQADSAFAIKSAPVAGAKTVTSSATEIYAGGSRLAARYTMSVYNDSGNTVYWGPSGVTTASGFPLFPGDTLTLVFSPAAATAIYLVAPASSAVRVLELA